MRWQRGQTLVELLVAMGLAAIMLPALLTGIVAAREGRAQESERLKATALLHEAEEAARSVREKNWTQFAINGTYYPHMSGGAWMLASGTQTVDGFTRQIAISDAQRNASGAIVDSGGTVDSSTKKVVTTVSWSTPITTSVTSTLYYQRYLNNAAWTQTTQADFTAGTVTNTAVTATNGGQVELATMPGGINWASPSIIGSYNAAGTQDALDIYTVGNYAYVSDGSIMTILDISSPATPAFVGSYTASATINHVFISGNYAYLSTVNNSAELIIVNISNPSAPTLTRNVDLPSTADARSTFVEGIYAYVGRVFTSGTTAAELYILNVSNPSSPTTTGSLNLSGTVNNIKVSGNYAYLATTTDTQELAVANVTNKSAPTLAGSYNAPGTADANDLGIDGTRVYLGLSTNASGAEVFTLNVATPSTPSLLASYEVGNIVYGVSVLNGYAFLATPVVSAQMIILDASVSTALTLEANVNLGSTSYDLKAHGDYVYAVTTSNTQEMIVVGPAISGGGYQTSGTFESSTLDVGASAAFNYLTFTITEPASTNIQLQIATNNDNTTWSFAGPDGTASTFYTTANAVPLNTLGRYVRYRASFTGTTSATPLLSDVSINYSP